MFKLNCIKEKLMTASAVLLSTISLNGYAATASFNPSTGIVDLPVVEVLNSKGSSAFYNAQLQLSGGALQLIAASPISATKGQRNVFDIEITAININSPLLSCS